MKKKVVVVPLDGTKHAEAALGQLQQFCDEGDEVILITVERPREPIGGHQGTGMIMGDAVVGSAGMSVGRIAAPPPAGPETREQAMDRQLSERRDYLEELAAPLRKAGISVQTDVLISDHPDEAIIRFARDAKPTFVAMLRKTRPGLREAIFGSTATSVVRAEVAPVLFIPAGIE